MADNMWLHTEYAASVKLSATVSVVERTPVASQLPEQNAAQQAVETNSPFLLRQQAASSAPAQAAPLAKL